MIERASAQTLLLLALGLSACTAQANEDYKGEPLLRLTGQASVNALTDGQLVKPALCFDTSGFPYEPVNTDDLPAPVADLFPAAFWPAGRRTITELDSHGQFPAEFNVSVYLPPPRSAVRPLFRGEPKSAQGHVCAVRAEHPDEVSPPLQSLLDCEDTDEKCFKRAAWATRETHRYFKLEYECPSVDSKQEECIFHTDGDALVAEEDFEYVLGEDLLRVLYLDEPAPAGSFTTWRNGVEGALSAGYHLFEVEQDHYWDDLDCRLKADIRAGGDTREKYKDELIYYPDTGASEIGEDHVDEFKEDYTRLFAQYYMESCERPHIHEVSQDESLVIVINSSVNQRSTASILFRPRP